MHYRNGREAHNGDGIVSIGDEGIICALGTLYGAAGDDENSNYCNGNIQKPGHEQDPDNDPVACLCDCLHVDDVAELLKEKGLDKRPEGM